MFKVQNEGDGEQGILRVALIVGGCEPKGGWGPKVLLAPGMLLPCVEVNSSNTAKSSAVDLLLDLTGVAARFGPGLPGWVDLEERGVLDKKKYNQRTFTSLFATMIPGQTQTNNGFSWVGISDFVKTADQDVVELVLEALRSL